MCDKNSFIVSKDFYKEESIRNKKKEMSLAAKHVALRFIMEAHLLCFDFYKQDLSPL